jgi:hypothetical protein
MTVVGLYALDAFVFSQGAIALVVTAIMILLGAGTEVFSCTRRFRRFAGRRSLWRPRAGGEAAIGAGKRVAIARDWPREG